MKGTRPLLQLLRLSPWRRGPRLLLQRPGVALALAAAAAVAALPAAAAPLFLSAAENATLHRQIEQTCAGRVGLHVTSAPGAGGLTAGPETAPGGADRVRQRHAAIAAAAPPGLAAPVTAVHTTGAVTLTDRALPYPDLTGLTLLGRPGFADQVEVVEGPVGAGLWLPDRHAAQQQLEVGDELELTPRTDDPGTSVTVPVAAIYRDLRDGPDHPFWCGVSGVYRGPPGAELDPNAVVLPTALADPETLLAWSDATGLPLTQVTEAVLLRPDLTRPEATALAAEVDRLAPRLYEQEPALFASRSEVFVSHLGRYATRSELVRTGLLPPVVPITAAAVGVGLAMTAAAAVFWVQRRQRELAVLAAHGVGPPGLGLKALVEAAPALGVGAAVGYLTGRLLVATVGPGPVLSAGAIRPALLAVAATLVLGLGLVATVAALRARSLTDARPAGHGPAWWRRVPWELSLVAAAPLAWLLLGQDRTVDPTGGVGEVAHVPARLLVAPILATAGTVGFAARLAAVGLTRGRAAGGRGTTAGRLLAWRRLTRHATATALLAAATAAPIAVAGYGATATGSIRTSADATLQLSLGSDTVLTLDRPAEAGEPPPVPAALAGSATEVIRLNAQRLDGLIVDVLGVDPETFADGAYWDRRITGPSLTDAMSRLQDGAGPTVVASRRVTPGPATLGVLGEEIPVQVADTRLLPGSQSAYPLVVIDRAVLAETLTARTRAAFWPQIWVAGDPDTTRERLAADPVPLVRVVTVDDHRTGAVYEPVTYTFQYLIALSLFTGLIGAVGLMLYLESRTAAHRTAYVMLRRLGLTPAGHRRAMLWELTGPVLVGALAGLAIAGGLAAALGSGFDLTPRRAPGALLDPPWPMVAVVGGIPALLAAGAGLLAHARIARARPAEVLRAPA